MEGIKKKVYIRYSDCNHMKKYSEYPKTLRHAIMKIDKMLENEVYHSVYKVDFMEVRDSIVDYCQHQISLKAREIVDNICNCKECESEEKGN